MLDNLQSVTATDDFHLEVVFKDGTAGKVNIKPYLSDEAFERLNDIEEFKKVQNGGYFIEWECGADLSADTLRYSIEHPVPS